MTITADMADAPGAARKAERYLLDANGAVIEGVSRAEVEARIARGSFFWLDLPGIGGEERIWLNDIFHFHPLAIEDAEQFGERPKLEEFPDYTFLVLFGSALDLGENRFGLRDEAFGGGLPVRSSSPHDLNRLAEVHFFIHSKFVVSVHRGTCPALRQLTMRMKENRIPLDNPARLFHRVADTLVDSFFPVLNALDEGIDELQGDIMRKSRPQQLVELLSYRSSLVVLRRVITPERDMLAGLASGVAALPGFDDEAQRYFRDIYDHLIRLADLIDSYRDLVLGTTDAYLSMASNQLNDVMKQLTIISTIFLPLSFLTGFFGQNFGWLVGHIGTWEAFVGIGLGTEAIAVASLLWLFRARGWLRSGG